jgi:arginyl-tRNA synthetase
MDFKQEIIDTIVKNTKLSQEQVNNLISKPPQLEMGNYAFPCYNLGKNPFEEAQKLEKKIKLPFLAKTEIKGPYLNFFIKNNLLAEETLTRKLKFEKQGKIILEFSSPNIAKPFGVGHLRSTVIGNSLAKVYQYLGYKVISVNHLGDWGTQFGKLIVAFKKWGNHKDVEKEPIKYLLKLYVKFHQQEGLEEEAREEFRKLEQGNKQSIKLWELFRSLSIDEFKKIYNILNIDFDNYHGEAFYSNMLDQVISNVQKKTTTEISDGALVVQLNNKPPLILKKTNGSTSYHTRDLAAAFFRLKKYQPDKIIYVVGSEQNLHFEQLFEVLEKVGEDKNKFVHVNFGLFKFPEGKMSTRKGNVIFLEDVLNKAIKLAEGIIKEKNPRLKNKKEVAKDVGVGAIIFGDLSNDRIRDVEFNWQRMLSFEGETGPYVQYTRARCNSIINKAGQGISKKINFETFNLKEELNILNLLYEFPEILNNVIKHNKPHHLCNYLIKLSQAFNEFYHQCPVISEVKQQMKARLLLVHKTQETLQTGLKLLGINSPEEM